MNSPPGLRAQDVRVPEAQVFTLASGDIPVGEVEAGPVIVARPSAIGRRNGVPSRTFRPPLRHHDATVAGEHPALVRADVFRTYDLHGGSAGTVTATLDDDADPANVKVLGEHGGVAVHDRRPHGPVLRRHCRRRYVSSAAVASRCIRCLYRRSRPRHGRRPRSAIRGIPGQIERAVSRDLWRYLAVLGRFGLLVEWLLYGRARNAGCRSASAPLTNPCDEAGIMTFAHPWVLIPARPAAHLPRYRVAEDAQSRRPASENCGVPCASSWRSPAPSMDVDATKVATVVLVDTSASISPSDLQHESKLVNDIERQRGRHWLRVIPFARASRDVDASENGGRLEAQAERRRQSAAATDMEAAVRDAIAGLPGGMAPRIAIMSDGRENQGSVARAAWLARDLHIPIDTFPLAGRPQPLLRIESSFAPAVAFTGEKFPIDLVVSSPKPRCRNG